jgi:flagellar hook-basal body complex protein FliE
MPAPIGSAIAAYAKTAANTLSGGMEARGAKDPGSDFMTMVQQAAESAIDAGKKGEAASVKAVAGNADVSEVVTAVANAEVSLQTAIAIRDKVIAAYQDISRMPI